MSYTNSMLWDAHVVYLGRASPFPVPQVPGSVGSARIHAGHLAHRFSWGSLGHDNSSLPKSLLRGQSRLARRVVQSRAAPVRARRKAPLPSSWLEPGTGRTSDGDG